MTRGRPCFNILTLALVLGLLLSATAAGVERFPPPDFVNHKLPEMTQPPPAQDLTDAIHVAALAAGLLVATWLALKRRSRRGLAILSVASLGYFGFYLAGCVCPIGSIQDVTAGLADSGFVLPLAVILIFLLPLVFALFVGRVFCSSVCPLGAIQDLILLRPVRLPLWIQYPLSLLPYFYLALAVLLAALGGGFVICEYDPFVSFFRLGGWTNILFYGGALLLVGLFVGRPYCRFLCPYGALLGLCSRVARWRVSITPNQCVSCRQCRGACPFGAIEPPTQEGGSRE
jgi:polyferredoxin